MKWTPGAHGYALKYHPKIPRMKVLWFLRIGTCCRNSNNSAASTPIGSMYGIFTNIYLKNHPNVGQYSIHGSYGTSDIHMFSSVSTFFAMILRHPEHQSHRALLGHRTSTGLYENVSGRVCRGRKSYRRLRLKIGYSRASHSNKWYEMIITFPIQEPLGSILSWLLHWHLTIFNSCKFTSNMQSLNTSMKHSEHLLTHKS